MPQVVEHLCANYSAERRQEALWDEGRELHVGVHGLHSEVLQDVPMMRGQAPTSALAAMNNTYSKAQSPATESVNRTLCSAHTTYTLGRVDVREYSW